MNKYPQSEEALFKKMKKSVLDAGGLFYQYRPCRRDSSTIYDIENIRHGNVYAQTPLNMNDPFDSMIGFSSEKLYNDIITMLLDTIEVDDNLKIIISVLLKYRMVGKFTEFLSYLETLKQYLSSKRKAMHQTQVPFKDFVDKNAKLLYDKAPKNLKQIFPFNSFIIFSGFVVKMEDVKISEKTISEMFKLDNTLQKLSDETEYVRDSVYIPEIRKWLSKLTVSCFSASGWDNQLMWSHYANSYSGICVEYDFSKITDFIGFIYPVTYTSERPTLSMQDLGITEIKLDGKVNEIKDSVDVTKILSYLLYKNICWSYEDEWRIINIDQENTPKFIDLPYVKSVTFGLNIDKISKRLLYEVCKEKNIPCYDISLSTNNYSMLRRQISDMPYNVNDEIAYEKLISAQIEETSKMLMKNAELFTQSASEGNLDYNALINELTEVDDFLSNAYFLKLLINRSCEHTDEDLDGIEIPNTIIVAINEIDSFVKMIVHFIKDTQKNILILRQNYLLNKNRYDSLCKCITNIKELVERYNSYSWNKSLIRNQYNLDETIQYYDKFAKENVDYSSKLQGYLYTRNSQEFINALELASDKSVLEIGVGIGRLATKIAPLCRNFYGMDISPKIIAKARNSLKNYSNIKLICEDFINYSCDRKFDRIYLDYTLMHISNKVAALIKTANLLNIDGLLVLTLRKSRDEYLESSFGKVHVYPDDPEATCNYLSVAQLQLVNRYETEHSVVIVAKNVNNNGNI